MLEKINLSPEENTGGSKSKKREKRAGKKEKLALTVHGSLLDLAELISIQAELELKGFSDKVEAKVLAEDLPKRGQAGMDYIGIWEIQTPPGGFITIEMDFTGAIGASTLLKVKDSKPLEIKKSIVNRYNSTALLHDKKELALILTDEMRFRLKKQIQELGWPVEERKQASLESVYMPSSREEHLLTVVNELIQSSRVSNRGGMDRLENLKKTLNELRTLRASKINYEPAGFIKILEEEAIFLKKAGFKAEAIKVLIEAFRFAKEHGEQELVDKLLADYSELKK